MADFEIAIVSRKMIQPSKPTPENLRRNNISAFDEFAPPMYFPILYYYLCEGDNGRSRHDERCHKLEKSLSQILTKFYPLAGRYMEDELCVHCGDQGVECIEAQVNGELAHFLQPSDSQLHILKKFLPWDLNTTTHSSVRPLLAVQINTFDCGGMVLGIAISHVVADGFTLATFMNEWAITSRIGLREDLSPNFGFFSSLFPAKMGCLPTAPPPSINGANVVTKIFCFDQTKITSIKESLIVYNGYFSKVVVVSAMILKAFLDVSLAKHGCLRDSVVCFPMNLRSRCKAAPPKLNISCGNFLFPLHVFFEAKIGNARLDDLVLLLRSSVEKQRLRFERASVDDILSMFLKGGEELLQRLGSGVDVYVCSSWCGFPFYEADFGWGKPHWVSDSCKTSEGTVLLMDSSNGGIQAHITLRKEDLNIFQKYLDNSA